jgi:hypothetical protein
MSNKKSFALMAAFAAMSIFSPSVSFAQATQKAFTPKIKTPKTSDELKEAKPSKKSSVEDAESAVEEKPEAEAPRSSGHQASGSPRRMRQHGLGLGIGQTFLFGDYADHGEDKITADLLYSYAASYSFDLLLDAHMSEHEHKGEKMKTQGMAASIKARMVEYDNFSPYVLGGLGFYAPRAKRDGHGWTEQKVTFGLNFGGGVDLRLNDNYVVGILGQMHWPFTVKQDEGGDLKGYYFKLLITGMYLF